MEHRVRMWNLGAAIRSVDPDVDRVADARRKFIEAIRRERGAAIAPPNWLPPLAPGAQAAPLLLRRLLELDPAGPEAEARLAGLITEVDARIQDRLDDLAAGWPDLAVHTIEQAIAERGYWHVYCAAIAANVIDGWGGVERSASEGFWRHAIATGTLALLAADPRRGHHAFAAGMLHHAGRLSAPVARGVIGRDEYARGAAAAANQRLPLPVVRAIATAGRRPHRASQLGAMVHHACDAATLGGFGLPGERRRAGAVSANARWMLVLLQERGGADWLHERIDRALVASLLGVHVAMRIAA